MASQRLWSAEQKIQSPRAWLTSCRFVGDFTRQVVNMRSPKIVHAELQGDAMCLRCRRTPSRLLRFKRTFVETGFGLCQAIKTAFGPDPPRGRWCHKASLTVPEPHPPTSHISSWVEHSLFTGSPRLFSHPRVSLYDLTAFVQNIASGRSPPHKQLCLPRPAVCGLAL